MLLSGRVALLLVSAAFVPMTVIAQTISHDDLVFLTAQSPRERCADGRPKVSDDLIARAPSIGTEEAWTIRRNEGYVDRFKGNRDSSMLPPNAGSRGAPDSLPTCATSSMNPPTSRSRGPARRRMPDSAPASKTVPPDRRRRRRILNDTISNRWPRTIQNAPRGSREARVVQSPCASWAT